MSDRYLLSPIEDAIAQIRRGGMVIVVDDEKRENEGDFIMAAEHATPEQINFMATHGRGLICVSMTESDLARLELPSMVANNTARLGTRFTVSVDLLQGTTTGISAADRARTIQRLAEPNAIASEFARPGHIFPIRAAGRGVLERPGHTEAAIDLVRLAGLRPAGVLCEILAPNGEMMRLPELLQLGDRCGLKLISIQDLIRHRQRHEKLVDKITEVHLPTRWGDFNLSLFHSHIDDEDHLLLSKGSLLAKEHVLVRVHSSCLTGDTFGSCRCDCGGQLDTAMRLIETEGEGMLVYLRQEGRGIGLANKLRAYKLQDDGRDTVEANVELGFDADLRDYATAAQILKQTGVASVRLLTNNPQKVFGLESCGISVAERLPLQIEPTAHSSKYLEVKRDKLGHLLELGD